MEITKSAKEVRANAKDVFAFLNDMNNWEQLMPHEKIENWQSSQDACSFKIKGLAGITMKRAHAIEAEKIEVVSGDSSPFPFKLNLSMNGAETCQVDLHFSAEINAFMAMMVEKPLGNFFQYLADQLNRKFQ